MRSFVSRKPTNLGLLLFILLGATYFIWANIEQTRSAEGGWVTDFAEPRKLVGYADVVFIGRVKEQTGEMDAPNSFPSTQFRVEVLNTIKSVRKLTPRSIESNATEATSLSSIVIVDQYGAHTRDHLGKRTLVLMDEQPLLESGQTYLLAAVYDPDRNWYHVLPQGSVLIEGDEKLRLVTDTFKKAKSEEILFTFDDIQGKDEDTPDPALHTP